jgi:hypothetical protein
MVLNSRGTKGDDTRDTDADGGFEWIRNLDNGPALLEYKPK